MNRFVVTLLIILAVISLFVYSIHEVANVISNMGHNLAPCNPICFPGSYDTTNPDCPCNQPDIGE